MADECHSHVCQKIRTFPVYRKYTVNNINRERERERDWRRVMQKLRGTKNSIAILAPCGGGWNVAAIGNVTKEIFFQLMV